MNRVAIRLRPGTLWPAIVQCTQTARASGVLRPIETASETVADAGLNFIVRKRSALVRKDEARSRPARFDPFLPYEEELFVADVSDSHLALLNKFNVIEHHLLIVTRSYEDQESLLGEEDFAALAACMREFDSLAFYNGGQAAGASQPHKHLQLVPLPLENASRTVPLEAVFEPVREAKGLCRLPALPFRHAFSWMGPAWFDDPWLAADELRKLYLGMLGFVALGAVPGERGARQPGPYNLLLTRDWMLLVPRSRECFGTISVNALGFAGSMFVRNDEQLQAVRQAGPMRLLTEVVPR
jgi:sulfate adenylyltransferase (ADP) / ATP adenylyltransferase